MDPSDDGEWIRHYAYLVEADKWAIQHSTDSRELRRLCADRDEYKARAERLAEALRDICNYSMSQFASAYDLINACQSRAAAAIPQEDDA